LSAADHFWLKRLLSEIKLQNLLRGKTLEASRFVKTVYYITSLSHSFHFAAQMQF